MQDILAPIRTQHVYHASIWRAPLFGWGILGLLLLVVVNAIISLLLPFTLDPFRDVRLFVSIYFVSAIVSNPRPTLIVTPERFDYAYGRRHVWAYWSDGESITRLPVHRSGFMFGEGLLLRTLGPRQRLPSRFIPLAWFARDWRESALGDDIRQYAPWLMEER